MKYHPEKHRLPTFNSNGVILVDKPAGWTSFDVVNFVRSRFNIPKVGHCGTLDPEATGLLVVLLGKFTRLSDKFSGQDKVYSGTLRLGVVTDSGDMAGKIVEEKDPSAVTEEALRTAIATFVGEQMQKPPMVSAVKVDGKKLYELARKGIEVERESKPITIHSIRVDSVNLPECAFTVRCSKGTYIRQLAADIGEKLGCGAVLTSLRRLSSGEFNVEDALTIDTLKTYEQADLEIMLRKFLFEKLSKIAGV
ncbi:MAG: tRNA pseudouridine(55) synthase TruB [Victivallaceae bacterium]|nr:tRNA pseudouridine(55) synthase TruB [Victivallaceae bacterium]